ncbi:MAG: hypothetical protein HQL50_06865 [Magnetococcales bacterium]|nr:hypothetical protein [Magnetococcales bacterium]
MSKREQETQEIDSHRLAELLASYGADSERWPESERDAITSRLESGANDLLPSQQQEAQALDDLLDLAPPEEASPELMARVLEQAGMTPWQRLLKELWPWGAAWRPAAALLCSMVMGLLVGGLFPGTSPSGTVMADPLPEVVIELAWLEPQEQEEDYLTLAFALESASEVLP